MRSAYTIVIRPRVWLWRLAAVGLGCVVLLLLASLSRASILGWIGGQLLHEDPMAPSDVIVVLSGGTPAREIEAADLFLAGYASRLVLTAQPERASIAILQSRGVRVPKFLDERLRYLEELGVPRAAMTVMGDRVSSTMRESELVADWVERHQHRSVILVTSGYHTARARWVFQRAFAEIGVTLRVRPDSLEPFDPNIWWRDRNMLRNGLFEWQKLIFYRLWYR
jgi:uncharacterized SAM-binding protein YcdF (DUF218 family)